MAPPQDVDPGLEQRLLTAMNECTQKLGSKISLALDKQGARIDALERLVYACERRVASLEHGHFDAETCADPLEQFAAEVEALKAGERRTRSGRAMQLDTLDKVAGAVTRGVTSKATTRGDDGGQGRKSEGQGRKSEGRKSEGQGRKAERVEHIPLRVLEPAPSPAKMTPRAKAKAGAKAKAAVKAAAKVKVEPNGKAANGGANVAANGRGKKPNGEANGASAKRKRAAEAAEAPEKVADEWLVNDGDFAYVGERIARCFGAIIVTGNVTGYVAQDEDPAHLWHVKHDDGDSEDLEQYEVVEGLRRYAENAAERSRRAQRGDLVAALRQRRLSFFGARSAEATAADAVADGAAAAAAAADVQAQWAVAHAPSHSRALVLERLRLHTHSGVGGAEAARVRTSFYFELPVDTQRGGTGRAACLGDVGRALLRGDYTAAEDADAALAGVFAGGKPGDRAGAAVRDAAAVLAKEHRAWVAAYAACATRCAAGVARTQPALAVDANAYSTLLVAGCTACDHGGCSDCPLVLPEFIDDFQCEDCAKPLAYSRLLPTAGLSDRCAGCAEEDFRSRQSGNGQAP